MSTTVHVQNIASQTTEKEVRDFFSFCGKINSLSVTPASDAVGAAKSATVTFEKETAARTALLLDNTQLGPNQVNVTAASSTGDVAGTKATDGNENDVAPEDKPRTRIIAEYLAHGYVISDKAIQSAIDMDTKHGISTRFSSALQNFDQKYKATDKVVAADEKLKVSATAGSAWAGFNSYFEKALDTPTGQRLRKFYIDGNKQVMDVHNEARHLANLKSGKGTAQPVPGQEGRTQCNCGSSTEKCPCAPGTCACSNCAKNPDGTQVASSSKAEEMGMEKLPGSDRTKCNCGSSTEKCPCEPGKCACANCAKNPGDAPAAPAAPTTA